MKELFWFGFGEFLWLANVLSFMLLWQDKVNLFKLFSIFFFFYEFIWRKFFEDILFDSYLELLKFVVAWGDKESFKN